MIADIVMPAEVSAADVQDSPETRMRAAKEASRDVARLTSDGKVTALHAIADALTAASADVIAANALDLARGTEEGIGEGLLDRLRLDEKRIAALAAAVREVAALPDPVGRVVG